jgi:hypothetical protein
MPKHVNIVPFRDRRRSQLATVFPDPGTIKDADVGGRTPGVLRKIQ